MSPPEKPRSPSPTDREAKLAQALRANLRRRKAAPRAPDAPDPEDDKRS
ncbi:MAG: hypothetical protein Q7S93_02230 [Phenylobacterium sp.]|nr:hypothetical protein [Phenylobacterium sp.]MDO8408869.1 hypothetical protein [Phenylobacterium sp.]